MGHPAYGLFRLMKKIFFCKKEYFQTSKKYRFYFDKKSIFDKQKINRIFQYIVLYNGPYPELQLESETGVDSLAGVASHKGN